MTTWLLYGGRGWIGSQFAELVPSEITLIHGESRCDDYRSLKSEIERIRPNRVIMMIGRTTAPAEAITDIRDTSVSTIDWLEKPGNLRYNLRDNLFSPLLVARITEQLGIHCSYLGTGCIFTYEEGATDIPIQETSDKPNFFGSSYSTVKGFSDQMMRLMPNVLNIRIRMPIVSYNHKKNFLTKILTYSRIHSTLNSMTVLEDLLPVLIRYISEGKTGTIHLVNPGPMTHNEILTLYREIVDPDFEWQCVTQEEIEKSLMSKRSKCVLNADEMEREGVPSLRESIDRIFREHKVSSEKIKL